MSFSSRTYALGRGQRFWSRALGSLLCAGAVLVLAAPGARAANRIFWGSCFNGKISSANLNGTGGGADLNTSPITPGCPQGVALDLATGKIYWADTGEGAGTTISFANLNGSGGGRHLLTTGATPPEGPVGVATDPINGKLYWGNYADSVLSFANLNNTGGGGDLSTSGGTGPQEGWGISIDPAAGKIYWASGGHNTISFANLDGTGHGGNLDTSGATVDNPEGVAIDPANGRIYWANYGDAASPISYTNLNGTGHGGNLNVTGATADGASGLAIDPQAGKLYWINFTGNTISFANLNGTGGGGELKTTGASPLEGAALPALLKAPRATARPKLRGHLRLGAKLRCSQGGWAPDLLEAFLYQRPVSFKYSWKRNGKVIAHATKKSIKLEHAGTYKCIVTAGNEAGATKRTSKSRRVAG